MLRDYVLNELCNGDYNYLLAVEGCQGRFSGRREPPGA